MPDNRPNDLYDGGFEVPETVIGFVDENVLAGTLYQLPKSSLFISNQYYRATERNSHQRHPSPWSQLLDENRRDCYRAS